MADQQQPSVSSIRVDKPGKAKFAPVIAGGDRKKPVTAVTTTQAAQPVPIQTHETSPQAPAPVKATHILTKEDEKTVEEPISRPSSAIPSSIQMIQQRRERRRPSVSVIASPPLKKPTSAASLAQGKQAPTMKLRDFTIDTNSGIPMSSSSAASSQLGSSAPASAAPSGRSTPVPTAATATRSVSTVVAPQVRVVGGEIVVDEDSALMEPVSTETVQMDIVHDSGRHLTSHAFVKTSGNNRWSKADTKKFYDALSMCGTDFSLISMLFPNRTREQIKGKYKVEERSNPKKLETFLKKRKAIDTDWLERVQKEKEGVEPISPTKSVTRGRPKQEDVAGIGSGFSSPAASPSRTGSLLSTPTKVSPSKKEEKSPVKTTPKKEPESPQQSPKKRPVNPIQDSPSPKKKAKAEPSTSSPLKSSSPLKDTVSAASSPRRSPRKVSKLTLE